MECLADERRRCVLDCLLNAESGELSFDEAVDHVVEEETHSPAPDREAVSATLYHRHLPKLAEEGLVEFDRNRGSIRATDETELAEPYLEFVRQCEREPEA